MRSGDSKIGSLTVNFVRAKLQMIVIGVAVCFCLVVGVTRAFHHSQDLIAGYTGARCMVEGCDPYDTRQLNRLYYDHGGSAAELPPWNQEIPVYPPSTLLLLSPLSALSFPVARGAWALLNGCSIILMVVAVLSACSWALRWPITVLLSFFLITSCKAMLGIGQIALPAISLVVIGAVLVLSSRHLALAAILMTLSIAIKPQISGPIVLYFLIKGIHRRHAALALAGALGLLLAASLILEERLGSDVWSSDLRANIASSMAPGGVNDPRPGGGAGNACINLQSITSVFFTDEKIFNFVAYGITLAILTGLMMVVWNQRISDPAAHFLALGALSAASLLPIYHRSYDVGILLVAIPAILLLWRSSRPLGLAVILFTVLAIEPLQVYLPKFLEDHGLLERVVQNKLLVVLLFCEQNLALLLLSISFVTGVFIVGLKSERSIRRG